MRATIYMWPCSDAPRIVELKTYVCDVGKKLREPALKIVGKSVQIAVNSFVWRVLRVAKVNTKPRICCTSNEWL